MTYLPILLPFSAHKFGKTSEKVEVGPKLALDRFLDIKK